MNVFKIVIAAGGLCLAGAAHAAEDAITLDRLEPTGEKRLCLKRNHLKGVLFLGEDTFLFATDTSFFTNKAQSACNPRDGGQATLFTQGSMVCRNDKITFTSGVIYGPYGCTLNQFHEVRIKTAPVD